MSSNNRQRHGKSQPSSVDSLIVSSHHSAARGDVNFVREDLLRKAPGWALTQTPPRDFTRAITWISEEVDAAFAAPFAGGFFEFPQTFALANCPGASAIANLFDQYCIYSVHARFAAEFTGTGGVPATQPAGTGQIITAVDYDSNNSLSSWANYQRVGTAAESELVIGKSYERYVKPTCAMVTGGSNSVSATGTAMARQWLNTSFPNVPHFGVRGAVTGNTTGLPLSIKVQLTYVIGLRNNF